MTAKVKVGIGVLVMLAVFATAFAFMNNNPVPVWPFRGVFSVTLVITASFALGTAFGVLATRLFSHVKGRRAEGVLEPVQPGQRERPGRP